MATTDLSPQPRTEARPGPTSVLFELGFRPFFLLAGVFAVLPMLIWLLEYGFGIVLATRWGGMFFHGHEMVFGFATAVIAGFLLTAVPKWTASIPVSGVRLAVLVSIWLAGRIAMLSSIWISATWVAAIDLVFYPALLLSLGPPLIRARRARNYFVPVVLFAFFCANLCAHYGIIASDFSRVRLGLHLGAYLTVILILIIGNRIIPSFTANALRLGGKRFVPYAPYRWEHPAMMALSLGALIASLWAAPPTVVAILSLLASLTIGWRLLRWHGIQALKMPIVWILHAGYGFIALGFLVLGGSQVLDGLVWSAAFHVFTAGGIGTMILAMMTRVSLGHTGRPLRVSGWIVLAYLLVIVGALIRSFATLLSVEWIVSAIVVGGAMWTMGFVIFVCVYAPILLTPRQDRA